MNIKSIEYDEVITPHPSIEKLENYYATFIIAQYKLPYKNIVWVDHVATGPDNFLHVFTIDDTQYALAFDDFPSGFSVENDKSVETIKFDDDCDTLAASLPSDNYIENVTGYFKLFHVVDDKRFATVLDLCILQYKKLREKWSNDTSRLVIIARDLVQLAETASDNHDQTALYSLRNIVDSFVDIDAVDNSVDLSLVASYIDLLLDADFGYEMHSEEEKDDVADRLYRALAMDIENKIQTNEYTIDGLGNMLTLASAIYAKEEDGKTSGVTATILFDGDKITYPRDHFINNELRSYFSENPYISESNIEYHMPEKLADYKLVAGTVEVQHIFRRELEFIYL